MGTYLVVDVTDQMVVECSPKWQFLACINIMNSTTNLCCVDSITSEHDDEQSASPILISVGRPRGKLMYMLSCQNQTLHLTKHLLSHD